MLLPLSTYKMTGDTLIRLEGMIYLEDKRIPLERIPLEGKKKTNLRSVVLFPAFHRIDQRFGYQHREPQRHTRTDLRF